MSRGGRGKGRGGRRTGPDIAWDDEPLEPAATSPEPLFPEVQQILPKPLSEEELGRVNAYRDIRFAMREGPLYTVLDTATLTDGYGKVNKRASFDPFDGMPTYSQRFKKPKRTLPDLSSISFELRFFPQELWSTIDPKKTSPEWKNAPLLASNTKPNHRKRKLAELVDDENEEEEEEEQIKAGGRKKRAPESDDPIHRKGQKRGLEAEDEIGPEEEDDAEKPEAADEVQPDSDFSDTDDDADDYNAEQYFDGGEDDDYGDDGGGGEDDVY